ncbi:MAG: hypothetical protein H6728_10685 [Myxococcales bacterium]|nr:hypothetical protein [Myxococcales bacterium]MCB9643525.1 hypothetical protein [Myxococcales bacterium]
MLFIKDIANMGNLMIKNPWKVQLRWLRRLVQVCLGVTTIYSLSTGEDGLCFFLMVCKKKGR